MYDKKNSVFFTDTECVVLSSNFKLPDENHMLLRVPRENNMYNVDLKNVMPSGDLTCLFSKDTLDESNLWYRRLGHINFKTMNKLVKGNLVRGLPSKVLKIIILVLLVRRESKIEPLNGVEERKNRTLIEAARTMLADSLLPISFWAEAVNTACCVQNRVLVTKPHNKTPYELLLGNLDVGKVRKETVSTQQYVLLPLWSTGFKDPQNIDAAATIDVKGNETEVHVSPSSSDKPKKHDEKSKREAKGKHPVDFAPVTAVRPNPTNSTNSFNAASPSDNAVNMPALEDIIYSDDEEDAGVEADFSNLETSITVSPILTTRVHKDHHVTQIIDGKSASTPIDTEKPLLKDPDGEDVDVHIY
nr:ribonuclease H-like domain-containing protein [Tanacetum cinerariifolium]